MPTRSSLTRLLAVAGIVVAGGCSNDTDSLGPAPFPSDPGIYAEGFAQGVRFEAFAGSKVDALSDDPNNRRSGSVGLRVTVPAPGDPSGGYAGGAFIANVPRDLTDFNALTFWARASISATLDVGGLGNDNTGTSRYTAQRNSIQLTTGWQRYVIPIPLASRLSQEAGLFFFAEGPENGAGYDLWFDDIQFEKLSSIQNPRPAIASATVTGEAGGTLQLTGTTVTFEVDGVDQTVSAAPGYFTFTSSNESVATVAADGSIAIVGAGTSNITATLGATPATGQVTLVATAPPAVAAPTPTRLATDVISLFSNAYTNVPVDTWSAGFDIADVSDVQIAGDDVKKYTNLVFAGVEFVSQQVNATAMTGFHMDVWLQDATQFKVKLVDFGANGAFGGGDDSEHEVTLTPATNPAITTGSWNSLDIPLSAFTGLTARGHVAQLIISGSSSTVYLDNVYFYKGAVPPPPPGPPTAAPTPTTSAANVISLFSNAYTNATVDTWSAVWDAADVADVQVAGNDTKHYTNLVFAGIEFTSAPVDASAMTGFHMDIWTPNPTAAAAFRVKLVDFGANGTFGGGDDVEHELTFTAASSPALATGSWVGLDVPLSAFTGLTTRGHLAQLIISGDLNTVFVDNVYFYASGGGGTPTAPTTAAPTPTASAANVISLFSNAYTNATVDTWSAVWDAADVADVQVAGNDTKHYTNLVFAGIEFTSAPVDASAMTGFHMDIWTPNPTAAASFKVKLVDFGANGTFGGGDDVEHELTFTAASSPALATGSWVALDVPLSAFAGLTTRGHLAQMIISGDLNTVFVDNVYFYASGGGGTPTAPTTAAPTPTASAANVISLFSNAYTNVTVDTWSAVWDAADVADVQVAGNDTKHYTNLVFAGIEFTSAPVDASAMTGFHMDIWTPNPTAAAAFRVKLVDFGADGSFGGGDDVEHELTFTAASSPALATGSWVALDVPLSAFAGLTTRGHLAQLIISGDLNTVFVDNVYFYASGGGGTPSAGLVFYDGYDAGVTFADFGGATNSVSVDAGTTNNGRSSFKAIITGSGGYSGGAFVASAPRDLSAYNALTFWAKGSTSTSTLKVGIGNNAANTLLNAESIGIPLTTTFTKFIIPLPHPAKMVGTDGLFHFADGPNNYTVWFNDVQYENLPSNLVGPPTAALAAWPSLTVAVGTPAQMNPAPNTVNWSVPALPNGGKLTDVAWRWYTLTSSNPSVATVSVDGLVTGHSAGSASITATLNGLAVPGNASITVTAPLGTPSNIAPAPTLPPGNVISLFSSAYTNVGVDTWRTGWSTCCNELVDPYTISGHDVKQYTLHHFVGVEFGVATPANIVDATTMTHLHLDVWSANPASDLEIQLVNDATGAAAVGIYHHGMIAAGTWVSLDIPLTSFAGLSGKNKLQQLLLLVPNGVTSVVYVDNVYFHN